jgi:hypothetical protein
MISLLIHQLLAEVAFWFHLSILAVVVSTGGSF